jgi:Mn2+/Fe2+ NRAMP family transporter
VVAVPVMAVTMVMTGDRKVMGRLTVRGPLRAGGWIATGCMAASGFGMVLTTLSQASALS